jgi:CHAT domain-containing protein
MTRLYEEIFEQRHRPPEALRRAQLWLRALTDDLEDEFLAKHPALEAEFRRRAALNAPPVRRRSPTGASTEEGPYAHPDYWAAFIAVGA